MIGVGRYPLHFSPDHYSKSLWANVDTQGIWIIHLTESKPHWVNWRWLEPKLKLCHEIDSRTIVCNKNSNQHAACWTCFCASANHVFCYFHPPLLVSDYIWRMFCFGVWVLATRNWGGVWVPRTSARTKILGNFCKFLSKFGTSWADRTMHFSPCCFLTTKTVCARHCIMRWLQ